MGSFCPCSHDDVAKVEDGNIRDRLTPETPKTEDDHETEAWFVAVRSSMIHELEGIAKDNPQCVDTFLQNGIRAVHLAVQNEDTDLLRTLHELGADMNAQTMDELHTPLHVAVLNDFKEISELLLSFAAVDTRITNASGKTAADLCKNEAMRTLLARARHFTEAMYRVEGEYRRERPQMASAFERAIGTSLDFLIDVWLKHASDRDKYWKSAVQNTGGVFCEGSVVVLLYMLVEGAHKTHATPVPDKFKANSDFRKGFKSLVKHIRNEMKIAKHDKMKLERRTVEENWEKWLIGWRLTLT